MMRMPEVRVWKGFVVGSIMKEGGGVGIQIFTPEGEELLFAVKFGCPMSNNEVEYEAVVHTLYILKTL